MLLFTWFRGSIPFLLLSLAPLMLWPSGLLITKISDLKNNLNVKHTVLHPTVRLEFLFGWIIDRVSNQVVVLFYRRPARDLVPGVSYHYGITCPSQFTGREYIKGS